MNLAFNMDCMAAMAEMEDNAFDLAIVDPPYGIGASTAGFIHSGKRGRSLTLSRDYGTHQWDVGLPSVEYFTELQRVSVNQVIWGGNHYGLKGTSCFIVWDKKNGENGYADCELAWTSFKTATRKFEYKWHGMLQEDMAHKERRIHPTQKPVALYKWLLTNYAKEGDKILDTHLGSGSSRIAAYDLGFDFTGYELDTDYFEAQEQRFANHIAQPKLFEAPAPVQEAMFA
jgi:site-specific DNA-methyltransferase (adenine-specific)